MSYLVIKSKVSDTDVDLNNYRVNLPNGSFVDFWYETKNVTSKQTAYDAAVMFSEILNISLQHTGLLL